MAEYRSEAPHGNPNICPPWSLESCQTAVCMNASGSVVGSTNLPFQIITSRAPAFVSVPEIVGDADFAINELASIVPVGAAPFTRGVTGKLEQYFSSSFCASEF